MPQSENLFRQKLLEESQRWTEENLLSSEQRDAILRRYEALPELPTPTDTVKEFPLFIRAVLALAVFMVGLAVLLLVSFNWQYLTGAVKLSIVGSALATAHIGGFYLRKTGWKNWADGVFFFAGIMYGVGIWQIGQVFHMPADLPMGLWLWALGAFLLAFALGSTPLHLLSIACFVAWVIADQMGPLSLRVHPWWVLFCLIPFTAWSLPVFATFGIVASTLKQKKFAATLYVFLLAFWWILQGPSCGVGFHTTFHITFIGFLCIALASWQFKTIHNPTLERVGVLLIAGGLIAPSFLDYWGELLASNVWNHRRIADDQIVYLVWCFVVPIINFFVFYMLIRLRSFKENPIDMFRRNKIVVILATTILALWLGSYAISLWTNAGHNYYRSYYSRNMLLDNPLIVCGMLTVNVLIVTMSIWLMLGGLKRERGDWFWSGVVFFLIWALVRYCDLFSGVGGMLGASAIFMFCGLFMIGIVYVWTTRRHKFRKEELVTENPPPLTMPIWWTTLGNRISLFWQSERNILTTVVIVAVLQFGILGAMIGNEMVPHLYGTTIQVRTAPVDPRDLFRGDYVILSYEFSRVNSIPGGEFDRYRYDDMRRTVYVSMQQDGDLWKAVGISQAKPKEGVFLRGTVKHGRIEYGIESYFVQEGTGKEIENAMRQWRAPRVEGEESREQRVVVELVVASNGKASIRAVHVQEE